LLFDFYNFETMQLSNHLFWDVDQAEIDEGKHCRFIIERVLTRGTLDDWNEIKKIYGKEKIKTEVLKIRHLDKVTLSFCSTYFNLPKETFRCYKLKQSIPIHWNY
jgi:hypothetical protein